MPLCPPMPTWQCIRLEQMLHGADTIQVSTHSQVVFTRQHVVDFCFEGLLRALSMNLECVPDGNLVHRS